MSDFNYGVAEIEKLGVNDEWRIKIVSTSWERSEFSGETHWLRLNDNQKLVIAALIREFYADNSR